MQNPMFIYTLVFIYGLLMGSFANVLIIRIPKNENWVIKPSHCVFCNNKLKWWMNIPLISYILLKGKCYFCHQKISSQYYILELLCGLKALVVANIFLKEMTIGFGLEFLLMDFVLFLLMVNFVIDLKHQILPDVINIGLLIMALIFTFLWGNWWQSLMGATIGFLGTALITYLFYLIKGEIGLGGGDIKLFGIIGLFLGPQGVVHNLLLSSLLGLLIALVLIAVKKIKKQEPFAFGPAIIIIFIIQLYFPNVISHVLP